MDENRDLASFFMLFLQSSEDCFGCIDVKDVSLGFSRSVMSRLDISKFVTDSGYDNIRFAGKGCQRVKIAIGANDGFDTDAVKRGGLLSRANQRSYIKCIRVGVS
jgi:hypothetical protein